MKGVKVLRCEDVKVFIDSTLDITEDIHLRYKDKDTTFDLEHLHILTSSHLTTSPCVWAVNCGAYSQVTSAMPVQNVPELVT